MIAITRRSGAEDGHFHFAAQHSRAQATAEFHFRLTDPMSKPMRIQTGITPGLVEQVTALHADYYGPEWNFGAVFSDRVHSEMTAFVARYDERRDQVWCVVDKETIAASITIDGSGPAQGTAHLRWFIVAPALRGSGYGHALMKLALAFCTDQNFDQIFLTTFDGLDAARHLYERSGFSLVASERGSSWGTEVVEQRFELDLRLTSRD